MVYNTQAGGNSKWYTGPPLDELGSDLKNHNNNNQKVSSFNNYEEASLANGNSSGT